MLAWPQGHFQASFVGLESMTSHTGHRCNNYRGDSFEAFVSFPEVEFVVILFSVPEVESVVILCTSPVLSPEADLRPLPSTSMQSHSRLCITAKMADCYWSEESSPSFVGHLLETHNIGAEKRAQVRPTCSIWEQYKLMDRTSALPQVKLILLSSKSLKIHPPWKHLSTDNFCGFALQSLSANVYKDRRSIWGGWWLCRQ